MKLIAKYEGQEMEVEVQRLGAGYRVRLGDRWLVADLANAGAYVRSLRFEDGTQFSLVHHREETTHEITLVGLTVKVDLIDPLSLKRRRREDETSGGGMITALMPGRVTRLLVNEGDVVPKGAGLLILEAMKMENEIQAPAAGTVQRILVSAGQTVEGGAELIVLE